MQPPLPLVGEAIEQKGTRAGIWHTKPIVPTAAAPGVSLPVLQGCSVRGMWPWRPPLPTVVGRRGTGGDRGGSAKSLTCSSRNFSSILSSQGLTCECDFSCKCQVEGFAEVRGAPRTKNLL